MAYMETSVPPIIGLVSYRYRYKHFSLRSVSVLNHTRYRLATVIVTSLAAKHRYIRVDLALKLLFLFVTENLLT